MSEIVRVAWETSPNTHTAVLYAADFYPLTGGDDAEDYAEFFANHLRASTLYGGKALSRVTVYRLDDGQEGVA